MSSLGKRDSTRSTDSDDNSEVLRYSARIKHNRPLRRSNSGVEKELRELLDFKYFRDAEISQENKAQQITSTDEPSPTFVPQENPVLQSRYSVDARPTQFAQQNRVVQTRYTGETVPAYVPQENRVLQSRYIAEGSAVQFAQQNPVLQSKYFGEASEGNIPQDHQGLLCRYTAEPRSAYVREENPDLQSRYAGETRPLFSGRFSTISADHANMYQNLYNARKTPLDQREMVKIQHEHVPQFRSITTASRMIASSVAVKRAIRYENTGQERQMPLQQGEFARLQFKHGVISRPSSPSKIGMSTGNAGRADMYGNVDQTRKVSLDLGELERMQPQYGTELVSTAAGIIGVSSTPSSAEMHQSISQTRETSPEAGALERLITRMREREERKLSADSMPTAPGNNTESTSISNTVEEYTNVDQTSQIPLGLSGLESEYGPITERTLASTMDVPTGFGDPAGMIIDAQRRNTPLDQLTQIGRGTEIRPTFSNDEVSASSVDRVELGVEDEQSAKKTVDDGNGVKAKPSPWDQMEIPTLIADIIVFTDQLFSNTEVIQKTSEEIRRLKFQRHKREWPVQRPSRFKMAELHKRIDQQSRIVLNSSRCMRYSPNILHKNITFVVESCTNMLRMSDAIFKQFNLFLAGIPEKTTRQLTDLKNEIIDNIVSLSEIQMDLRSLITKFSELKIHPLDDATGLKSPEDAFIDTSPQEEPSFENQISEDSEPGLIKYLKYSICFTFIIILFMILVIIGTEKNRNNLRTRLSDRNINF